MDQILFETGASVLLPSSIDQIKRVVDFMKVNPNIRLCLNGYTDNIGDADFNQKLSLSRAQSVARALIHYGVNRARIQVKGYGETQPIAPNTTASGRAQNRRTTFTVL